MGRSQKSATHDHDYCFKISQEKNEIEMVMETIKKSSPRKDSFCLSPTSSSDSGIDSIANDLVNGFSEEGDDLLNFLLDNAISDLDFKLEKPLVSKDEKRNEKTPCSKAKLNSNSDEELQKSRKNAENAKENRRKKKLYVEGLEMEVGSLRREKDSWTGKSNMLEKKIEALENEVDYLKSVLANQSMLSKLIKGIPQTAGVSLSTSLCSFRKSSSMDNEDILKNNEISLTDNEVSSKDKGVCSRDNGVCSRNNGVCSENNGLCHGNNGVCPGDNGVCLWDNGVCLGDNSVCSHNTHVDHDKGEETCSTVMKRTCPSEDDVSPKRSKLAPGGVCLHVKESKVSLEFCRHCSKMADD